MRSHTALLTLLAGLMLAPTTLAQQTYTMFERTYAARGDAAIKAVVADADLTVVTGSEEKFHVAVHVRAKDEDAAQSHYDAQQYTFDLQNGTLEVQDEPDRNYRSSWRSAPHVHISLTAPESVDLRLRTSDGDLVIGDIDGDVFVRTSDGDIVAANLSGVMLEARSSDGDIVIESAEFKNVVVQTSDGDIVVEHADAEEVTAITSDGDIQFGVLSGVADVRTSDGDIHMGSLASSSGKIRTSDGDIVLESAEGKVTASTSDGSLVVDLLDPDEVKLTTSDGDIVVSIPESHGAQLNLRGTRVTLDCCQSFEGRKEERHVEGLVNGGGAAIQLSASDGTVVLRSR